MFDDQKNAYVPTLVGLGMLVQVHDPDDKELLSRVMYMLPKIIFVYRTFLITNLMQPVEFYFWTSGKYKIQDWDEDKQIYFDQPAWSYGMHVEVLDPTGKPQLSRVTAGTLAV